MTTTDQTEFERVAALTIKATDAVADELENGGDAHTCVVATMGVFQPEIDRLRAEVQQLRAEVEDLRESDRKLNALECAGVDNWDGYSYAMEILNEEESR